MNIRKALSNDIEQIVDFQLRMASETEQIELDINTTSNGVNHIFNNPGYGFYLVCESDNQVIGCLLILYEWSDWRNHKVVWIHSVYVKPEFRKRGIFKQMYHFVRKWAESDPEIGGIRLYVDKNNKNAQSAYEKLGMNSDHYILYEWIK